MAKGKIAFRQADVLRAVKGFRAAGLEVGRVEIDQAGKITIVSGKADVADGEVDHLAVWKAEQDARTPQGHK